MNIIALVLFMAILLFATGLLERNQRRTAGLDRSPYGSDLETDRDLARTRTEVAANRAHQRAA
ncbi:MAG: hypothetical protein JWO46_50 [Nocardioidaceae bacterium]|nr:hypothetical protein [Nocardioidaceae bacterium]